MSQYECSANPSTATVTIGLADVNIVVPEKFNHVNLYSYGPEFTRGMSLTFVVDSADSARKVGEAFLALADRMQAPATL